eukprot:SAG11_NODE_8111_length_1059_cov_1.065625_1_plen_134_part_00
MCTLMVATAVERPGLQRRIALRVLLAVGTAPRRLLLGFMLARWLLSMWISNSATGLLQAHSFGTQFPYLFDANGCCFLALHSGGHGTDRVDDPGFALFAAGGRSGESTRKGAAHWCRLVLFDRWARDIDRDRH